MQNMVSQAIVTAYLLTGAPVPSQAAVTGAIELWEPNGGVESLLELVARLALEYRGNTSDEWPLPPELQRLVWLPYVVRAVFVLRLLLGFPRRLCARLLDLKGAEVDEYTRDALITLAAQNYERREFENVMNDEADHNQIERLAYELWQQRGSPLGSPEEDWFHAESQFRGERSATLSEPAFAIGPIEE